MSAGPTSEGTLHFVKTYEVGMNTDSPNGPGPERLICRIPCRPAQIEPNCRPADVAACRPGLPPAGRWLSTTRRLAWPDLPTWIAGGRERRLTPRDGCYEPGCRCATRAPRVRRRGVQACPPRLRRVLPATWRLPVASGNNTLGSTFRHRAGPQRSVPQAHRRKIVRLRDRSSGTPSARRYHSAG